jgi:LuxR family maltose regulon positive regulatory protein
VTGDVARYLTKRVLATLPESERELLIQISFLDEFSGELVEAVTGLPDCWQALEELERSSLLIAGAARRGTLYRCHNLLREVMFAQLRRRGRKELVRLELAAAHWYRQAGDFTLAVRHAAAAEAFDLAARFVEESGAILYGIRYGAPALAALLQMVPPAVTGRYPRLMLAEVFLLAKDSRLNAAADLLHSVKLRVDAAKAERERTLERSLLRDLTIAEMTFVIYGGIDIGQIRFDLLEEEVASAAPENHWMRGLLNNVLCVAQYRRSEFAASLASAEASLYYYGLVRSSNGIGHMNVHLGIIASEAADPAGALGHYRQARAAFEGGLYSDLAGCAIAEAMEAEALYERGEFDESRQLCAAALAVAEGAETHYELMVAGYRTLSALVAVERGPQEAVRSLDMPLAFVRRRGFLQVERFLLLRRTELALMAGEATAPAFKEPEAAARMAGKSYALPVPGWREADLELRVEARLALNLGDGAEAVGMLTAHATTLERGGRIRSRVQTLTLLALAHAQEGLATEALKRLKEAVGLALHGRLVSPFVEAGRGLLPLLAQLLTGQGLCAADPAEVEFLNRIIKLSTRVNGAASGLFSERERDIVRLLIQGTNNKLIARALGISPDTVRFHLKHIYEKFGVSDRRVVAELAREHGLVA